MRLYINVYYLTLNGLLSDKTYNLISAIDIQLSTVRIELP